MAGPEKGKWDTLSQELVENGGWEYLEDCLLTDVVGLVSESQLRWIAQEVGKRASQSDLVTLVKCIPNRHLHHVLTETVKRGLWEVVTSLLRLKVRTRWVVSEAMRHADDQHLSRIFLCCTADQLEGALETAVARRLWPSVGKLLARGVSDAKRAWAIREAIQHADNKQLEELLPQCGHEQLELALQTAVARRLWAACGRLVYLHATDTQRAWAVEEAMKYKDDTHIGVLLSHCTDDQLGSALTEAVTRGLWDCVEQLLRRGPSEELRRWAVAEASKHASDGEMQPLLRNHYWDEDQHDSLVDQAVERGLWKSVLELLKLGVTQEQLDQITKEAAKRACEDDLGSFFRGFNIKSESINYDLVLPSLLERQQWWICRDISFRSQRDAQAHRRLILKMASEHATGDDLNNILCDFCTEDDVDLVLSALLERKQWNAIIYMTGYRMSTSIKLTDTQQNRVVTEACKYADDADLKELNVPDNLLDHVVSEAVKRGKWNTVTKLITGRVTDSVCTHALDEAMQHADDENVRSIIIRLDSRCSFTDNQRDVALTEAVNRGMWKTVGALLSIDEGNTRLQWAVLEACKCAGECDVLDFIHRYSDSLTLDPLLTELVGRGLWDPVVHLLQLDISDKRKRWSVEEAMKHADNFHLPYILRHCTDDQLDSVLSEAATRGLWDCVRNLMTRQVSDAQRRWAIEEACKHATDDIFATFIHENDWGEDEIDSILTGVVSRGLWRSMLTLLSLGKTHHRQRWAVLEGIQRALGAALQDIVLRYCVDDVDMLETALPILTEREQWELLTTLQPHLSASQRRTVISEASKIADDANLKTLVHDCPDDLLDSVVTDAVTRDLWATVSDLLQCPVSDTVRMWAVGEAMVRAEEKEFASIIYYCADDQRASVVTETVRRRLWADVEKLLERGVTNAQLQWAVVEASKYADREVLLRLIQNYSGSLKLRPVVRAIVGRPAQEILWDVTWKLLNEHSVDENTVTWVVDQAMKVAPYKDFAPAAAHCGDHQVEAFMKNSSWRRHWSCVNQLMPRARPDTQRWVVREASKHAGDKELLPLLSYCADDQVDCVLRETVKRRLWQCVEKLQSTRHLPDALLTWTISEASKYAPVDSLQTLIENHCTEMNLDLVLREVARRGCWSLVWMFLDWNVSETTRTWAFEEAITKPDCTGVLYDVTDDQAKTLLTNAVEKHRWDFVKKLIDKGSERQQGWVLLEASQHAEEMVLCSLIQRCPDDHVDQVLTEAVKRGLWECVSDLLRTREVSDTVKNLAAVEASRHASSMVLRRILHACEASEVRYSVLTETVRRGLWEVTRHLLTPPLDFHRVQTAVSEATDEWTSEKLNSEMSPAVNRCCWPVVCCLLSHPELTDTVRRNVVDAVCRSDIVRFGCTEQYFMCLCEHCESRQLMSALQATVRGNMPRAACKILARMEKDGDLLVVTNTGTTIMSVVLGIKVGYQELLTECIKLGLTTHQPSERSKFSVMNRPVYGNDIRTCRKLFESGVCSNSELREHHDTLRMNMRTSEQFHTIFHTMSTYIKALASTPRSLKSMCRLVISRRLGVGYAREERVKELPLPEPLRDFVLFSDLVQEGMTQDGSSDTDQSAEVQSTAFHLMPDSDEEDSQ